MNEPNPVPNAGLPAGPTRSRLHRFARLLSILAPTIAVAPLMVAAIISTSGGVGFWDESDGAGAFLWLLFVSLPVGGLVGVLGLLLHLIRRRT